MQVLISGGTGFIGSALIPVLQASGHQVVVLTRRHVSAPADEGLRYIQSLAPLHGEPVDAVINLAGASMAGRRWNSRYKRQLATSRLNTTSALIAFMRQRQTPPAVFLSASAVGYYGDHPESSFLVEDAHSVPGFSSDLCRAWEQKAAQAEELGVRTCYTRFGVVLGADGGALGDMARPFRFGMANWLGRGDQWLSWVHISDAVAAIVYLLDQPCLNGPFNVCSPVPVTSKGFCRAMRSQFRTLPPVPVPGPVLRLVLGEVADELLLAGQRAVPAALQEAGFDFRYRELEAALAAIYGD